MRIGFHMPFSGSLEKLRQKIHVSTGNSFQIFARSLRGVDKDGNPHPLHKINSKKLGELHQFLDDKNIEPFIVHAPYFYNLSQGHNTNKAGEELDHKTLILEDLAWAHQMGATYYVLQPGYFKQINPFFALENIKDQLIDIMEETPFQGVILVKNTAGAGTEIASTLGEWNELISFHPRVKGALDFARIYASGHDFTTKETARIFVDTIEEVVGWEKIRVLYLNDTTRHCGAKKQPSSPPPLGEGVIGFYGYEHVLRYDIVKRKVWLVENQPKPSYYDESIAFLRPFFEEKDGD